MNSFSLEQATFGTKSAAKLQKCRLPNKKSEATRGVGAGRGKGGGGGGGGAGNGDCLICQALVTDQFKGFLRGERRAVPDYTMAGRTIERHHTTGVLGNNIRHRPLSF